MQDHHRITPWLDHLRLLLPPSGVVLVGAGTGAGEWVQRLQEWDIPNVTLVEADDAKFRHLQRAITEREGWQLLKQVIARDTEAVTYFLASNAAESGLLEPESLRSLWPNIKTRQEQTREAIALAELLQDFPSASWLMLDCLLALPLIEGAAGQLDRIDVIAARVLFDETDLHERIDSLPVLQSYLHEHGYRLLTTEISRHPAIGHALFVRDTLATIRGLRQELSQAEQGRQRDIQRLTDAWVGACRQAKVHADRARKLTQAQVAAEKLAAEGRQQFERLNEVAEQAKLAAAKQVEELTTQVNKLSQANATAENLATELHTFRAALIEMQRNLENCLIKEMVNTKLQIENYIGISRYQETGMLPLPMHGWPISPDLGVFIIELIESNEFDVIIEFGTGSSTSLVASCLFNKGKRRFEKCSTKFIAFEHLPQYYESTNKKLMQGKLEKFVDTVYAPLVPYRAENGNEYLYYEHVDVLRNLSNEFGNSNCRALILVDGPPSSVGKNSRYPALPIILQYLPSADIDVLLDDYDREDEKQIVSMWMSDLNKNNKKIKKVIKNLEKGAAYIEVR